ncbi:MAG: hypothetical protein KJN97_01975 [Deltaproteobacteria bacterium]|nr:hypothetical protein [Deltaproteobacteria bacterium]
MFEQLTAGKNHSCGVEQDGTAVCWGFVPCGGAGEEACGAP